MYFHILLKRNFNTQPTGFCSKTWAFGATKFFAFATAAIALHPFPELATLSKFNFFFLNSSGQNLHGELE